MQVPPEPPALNHIEKTLADAYRKEIDQEENIWRSLPFFAATLALQLAALFQLIDRIPPPGSPAGAISVGIIALNAFTTLTALGFLAASISPAKFNYVAPEPELLTYAKGLIEDEEASRAPPAVAPINALIILKTALAEQYAIGAQHNRQINKRREKRRSIAGLATIASVFLTLLLVGSISIPYIQQHIWSHIVP
ncbi:MAG TPA: hypothetical protein VGM87_00440 [Roseomonas sp.]|jgi:hypothetical protein